MPTSNRTVVLESLGASAAVCAGVALASPRDPWLGGLGLHPAWLAVLLLAARYGPRGLFLALGLTWGGLAVTSQLLGLPLGGLLDRVRSGSDVLALAASILVAWIGLSHASRTDRAAGRLAAAAEREHAEHDTVAALHESLACLRARHDRIDLSLTFWREVSRGLASADPVEAAAAALELCAARCAATAVAVHRWDGTNLWLLARQGAWASPAQVTVADRTARAAATGGVVVGEPDPAGRPGVDGDLAVPVIDAGSGVVIAVISLRLAGPGQPRPADASDAVVIAGWLAPALGAAAPAERSRQRAAREVVA